MGLESLYTWDQQRKFARDWEKNGNLPTNEEWEEMVQHYGGVRMDSRQDGKEAYNRLIQGGDNQFNIAFGGSRDSTAEYRRPEAHGFTGPQRYMTAQMHGFTIWEKMEKL